MCCCLVTRAHRGVSHCPAGRRGAGGMLGAGDSGLGFCDTQQRYVEEAGTVGAGHGPSPVSCYFPLLCSWRGGSLETLTARGSPGLEIARPSARARNLRWNRPASAGPAAFLVVSGGFSPSIQDSTDEGAFGEGCPPQTRSAGTSQPAVDLVLISMEGTRHISPIQPPTALPLRLHFIRVAGKPNTAQLPLASRPGSGAGGVDGK